MMSIISKTRISNKLLLISLTYTLPIAVMLWLIITGINKDITFARMETYGDDYQGPLEDVLNYLPQHQLVARDYLRGKTELKSELEAAQTRVDKAMDELDTMDRKLGATLQFTDEGLSQRKRDNARVSVLRASWQTLKSQLPGMKIVTSDEQHQRMVATIRTMITHAGDISNLILDPDLDTYYLMDVTLLALPQTQDRLGTIIVNGSDMARDKEITAQERTQFAIYASMLKEADVDRIVASLRTSLNEDPNFYGRSESLQHNIPPALDEYLAANRAFITLLNQLGSGEKAGVEVTDFIAAGTRAREASFKLWDTADHELDILFATRIGHYENSRLWALGLTSIALAVAGLLVWALVRSISGPLTAIAATLSANAAQVASASGQFAGSSQSLAQGAGEQAAALEESGSSLQQMAAMTRTNAQTAEKARQLSGDAKAAAGKGETATNQMSAAIDQIQKSASETAKIIKVIDDIAFQTNLLALNAAVEAARAGEAGKGFAVVAEEVRNLAIRSAEAARTTASLIEQSVQSARNGMVIASDVGKVLQEITSTNTNVNTLVGQIAVASKEQAQGIEQVNVAVTQMDKVTQANAAYAEESASASQELSAQAEQLNGVVRQLIQLVGETKESKQQASKTLPKRKDLSRPAPALSSPSARFIPLDKAEEDKANADFSDF